MRHKTPVGTDADALAALFAGIALKAAVPIMEAYSRTVAARFKADLSPVTEADERAEEVILAALAREAPGIPVVSEEAVSRGERPNVGAEYILVDPLDGTREFIARNGEFAVNIALVRDGAPICGAMYAPVAQRLWFAGGNAFGVDAKPGENMPDAAHWRALRTRQPLKSGLVALISRSHLDARSEALLDQLAVIERRSMGSSIKFGVIAQGDADLYPRFAPTMAWDIAAGDAILRAAGGMVLGEDGAPMRYHADATGYCNCGFVAWGTPSAAAADF